MSTTLDDRNVENRRQRGMELVFQDGQTRLRTSYWQECLWISLLLVATYLYISNLGYVALWFQYLFRITTSVEFDSASIARNVSHSERTPLFLTLLLLYTCFALWMLRKLLQLRLHQFELMRNIRRVENYFHLADPDFAIRTNDDRNTVFPTGFGHSPVESIYDPKQHDGTSLFGWFLRRHLWILGFNLLVAFLAARFADRPLTAHFVTVIVIHFVAACLFLGRSWRRMEKQIIKERHLVGANPADYETASKDPK